MRKLWVQFVRYKRRKKLEDDIADREEKSGDKGVCMEAVRGSDRPIISSYK